MERDRCKLGVYTVFQFVGLVYWGLVLAFPTATILGILYVLAHVLAALVFLSVIPIGGMGIWLSPGLEIFHFLFLTIGYVLLALVTTWVLVPLTWLTCLIGAILGSIASCGEPHGEAETAPVPTPGNITVYL